MMNMRRCFNEVIIHQKPYEHTFASNVWQIQCDKYVNILLFFCYNLKIYVYILERFEISLIR